MSSSRELEAEQLIKKLRLLEKTSELIQKTTPSSESFEERILKSIIKESMIEHEPEMVKGL